MGDRIPAIWISKKGELWVIFPMNNKNKAKNVGRVRVNRWMKVEIKQTRARRRRQVGS